MSSKKCCVPRCTESGQTHLVLHGFPNPEKYPARFRSWVLVIGGDILGLSNQYIYNHRRVCHAHFEEKYCCRLNRISKIAEPTINLPDSKLPLEPAVRKGLMVVPTFLGIIDMEQRGGLSLSGRLPGASLQKVDSGQNLFRDEVVLDKDQNQNKDYYVIMPGDDFQNVDDAQTLVDPDDDCQVVSDDDELSLYPSVTKEDDNKDIAEKDEIDQVNDIHEGFMCNFCSGVIKGYRYTCVQCPDYDLCGSCEAKGAHCLHYVLRIPAPRPYAEIQSVLIEIRKQLLYEVWKKADTQADAASDTEIKEEVEDEDAPDPLQSDEAMSRHVHRDTHTDTVIKDEDEPDPMRSDEAPLPLSARSSQRATHTDTVSKDEDGPDPMRSDEAPLPLSARSSQRATHTDTEDDDWALPLAELTRTQSPLVYTVNTDSPHTRSAVPARADNASESSVYKARTIVTPGGNTVLSINAARSTRVYSSRAKRKHDNVLSNPDKMPLEDVQIVENAAHGAVLTLKADLSASPRVVVVRNDDVGSDNLKKPVKILSNTLLSLTNSSVTTSSSNKVQVPVNVKCKRKLEGVSKPDLELQDDATKRMKVVLTPLSEKVLSSADCDLSTGVTSTAGF